ncbi:MAG: AI-2E family transporter, partial [Lachnospiraceae bacterium]|nr:AI-2E family transporter [Lachnospiraceae bacterium]
MNPERDKFRFWFKILLTVAVLSLCVIRFDWLCFAVRELYHIVQPFLIGGLIAFVLNIPMRKIERTLFGKAENKIINKLKRPVSIVLTLILLVLVLAVMFLIVVPQVVETAAVLPEQIKNFYYSSLEWILMMMQKYPDITETLTLEIQKIMEKEIDWQKVVSSVTDFFFNGIGGSFIKNTFSFAGKIGGGVVNAVISIIFSIYLLTQKEKLGNQGKRILSAFLSEKAYGYTMRVITLLGTNFSNFIAGQCIEAVILGLMIMIPMLILGFDYALLVGVLVGFTSLIPVVGAFIGCGIGAFLFLLQDPITALWFVLLFLIVQQIEGNLIYPYVVGNSVGLP